MGEEIVFTESIVRQVPVLMESIGVCRSNVTMWGIASEDPVVRRLPPRVKSEGLPFQEASFWLS